MHLSLQVAWAAVRSKVVVLLFLIYCLMYFPLFWGVLCLSLFLFCITLCPFYHCNHLEEEEKAGCLAFIVLQMYCNYKCSVALSHGVVCWSVACDCGIS